MENPELILFDYGHTLVYEEYFDIKKGAEALYAHIQHNNYDISSHDFVEFAYKLYFDLSPARRTLALEIPASSYFHILREYYGIEFDLDEIGLQELFWDNASPPVAMPGAKELLDFLYERNIMTAVISNLWYKEEVLKRRIDKLLPDNHIKFYMSTCEYGIRKPNAILFEIALKKAKISKAKTWFCGDEPIADIYGSYNSGIIPIWFESNIACPYKLSDMDCPSVKCTHITRLEELMSIII